MHGDDLGVVAPLFLTSKVRLHCDELWEQDQAAYREPFPDLKGQAPLRRAFSSSKQARHCHLFLTSKVRLHCDKALWWAVLRAYFPFPDLKGQAPLRPGWGVSRS